MAIPINMEYFDEYLRQGDPLKKERAEAWRVAIGLRYQTTCWNLPEEI